MTALIALLGAILFRIRGGLLPWNLGQGGRLIWSIGYAGVAVLTTGNPWLWFLVPTAFFGAVLSAEEVLDLVKPGATHDWPGAFMRSLTYTIWNFIPIVAFTENSVAACIIMLSGLSAIPAYIIGWKIPSKLWGLRQGPEIGEALTGAALLSSLWIALNAL